MTYFDLASARDMFQKAEREFTRLEADCNIDNVFNFFVSAYHIQDYLRKTNAVRQYDIDTFMSDTDIKDCRDLCNKGKHLKLTKQPNPQTQKYSGTLNGAPLNTLPLNSGEKWFLNSGGRSVEIIGLAKRVIEKWNSFLSDHGL